MAESSHVNIPWTSLAVVAAFVSSFLLPQMAFQAFRPTEKDTGQSIERAEPEAAARLWEDPFAAMRRHETERMSRCDKLQPQRRARVSECVEEDVARRRMGSIQNALHRDKDNDLSDSALIFVMAPGMAFAGNEEIRRRSRYAVLSGFHALDYVPERPGRIGIARLPTLKVETDRDVTPSKVKEPCGVPRSGVVGRDRADADPREQYVEAPYELLSQRPILRNEPRSSSQRYSQVVLIWIDDSMLPAPKLDNLGHLIDQAAGCLPPGKSPHVAIIGPSSSDALRAALVDLDRAAGSAAKLSPEVRAAYERLARAEILSPSSTAPNRQFDVLKGNNLEAFVADKLQAFADKTAPSQLKRMIAPDNEVLKSLVAELNLRLPDRARRRVVLVAERDSLYAQGLVTELRHRMADEARLQFEPLYYFRGIDGMTFSPSAEKVASAGKPESSVEWPESRDQLDYLRRMAESLKASEGRSDGRPIGAIGVLGHDVHDKLLVLQALRETFPDKVFFTTDMDARYLHPRAIASTRNLIVATSLPLQLGPELQAGVPPLRDVYQTATYLAARRAACRSEECKKHEDGQTKAVLDKPSVYEIGRDRAVAVAGYARERELPGSNGGSNPSRSAAAGALIVLLAGLLLVWPSTPALRRAGVPLFLRQASDDDESSVPAARSPSRHRPSPANVNLPIAMLVALHMAMLAYAVGSAIEFVRAGSLGVGGVVSLATLSGVAALLACYPRADGHGPAQRHVFAWLTLTAVAAALVWMAWAAMRPEDSCPRCEPVAWLQGISAWPSHLIRLLALLAIAYAFDLLWCSALASLAEDSKWLSIPAAGMYAPLRPDSWRRRALPWFARITLARWHQPVHGSVDFGVLWRQYKRRGRPAARVARVLVWYAVTLALLSVLYVTFSDGYVPEIPVRGADQRRLVAWTFYAALLLLPLLTVAVADATMLTCRFVWNLNRARTRYPEETIDRLAHALGPAHHDRWIVAVAGDPSDRALMGPLEACVQHSLLDDWIDIQVVARRTKEVMPFVIWPFCVVALLVVAHSRLFDNWALTLPMALIAGIYLAWLLLLSALLKVAAETTRRRALERMQADLRWLAGTPDGKELVETFERLIKAVEGESTGAFAPIFEQPFMQAVLVPLGGAGGAQLFDRILSGRLDW